MQFGCPGARIWMLMPNSVKRPFSSFSNVVAGPNDGCRHQSASRALTTNHPSPSGTRPASLRTSRASCAMHTSCRRQSAGYSGIEASRTPLDRTVKIAIVGRGNVGGGLARLWEKAGHDVSTFGKDGGDASGADILVVA